MGIFNPTFLLGLILLLYLASFVMETEDGEVSFTDVVEELNRPGSREANIVQTVSDSKEFISSTLRGIQEIQMAVSFVGMTKEFNSIHPDGSPLYLNVAMNEFGIDMHRLDPKSPAHRMYFSSKDTAHQALLAAISIAVSLDDGHGKPERILYVPMATTTVKTTLPSKSVAFSQDENVAERNANILFANLVVTSPSVDLDPKHVPLVLALVHSRQSKPSSIPTAKPRSHHLISRLLPKAHIKFSVHEPVMRVTLPPADSKLKCTDEYDLLILSIASISLDVESSHFTAGEFHYALNSNLRLASGHLYYHTAAAERHNLLITDALELKVQLNASPEVSVIASGNLQTFSVHMVRPEISSGVHQIVQQLSKDSDTDETLSRGPTREPDFLRPLPSWLVQFSIQGSNFGVEIAGVDDEVSTDTRGVALQLESWTAEYKIQRTAPDERPPSRRHATNKVSTPEEPSIKVTPPPGTNEDISVSTDGRRLAIHVRGLEGFIVDGMNSLEQESFISLPRFEVAFSTSSDTQGPIFHVNSHTKALYLQYSLYRYYAMGVATAVLRKAFVSDRKAATAPRSPPTEYASHEQYGLSGIPTARKNQQQLVAIDVKAELVQIKARMPSDPPMMLQIRRMEAGRHRWAMPFMKSQFVRLYAEAPQISMAWARILTAKGLRVDLRENRRRRGTAVLQENSIDVVTDFIRIGIPHQLVLHKIFDNLVNAMKASEQLYHRFKTGSNEYILKKRPEKPKKVPRISVRSKALLFDIEDGPFDWKLGTIYRIGLIEQRQRLTREEAFKEKVKTLESHTRGSSRYRAHVHHSRSQKRDKSKRSRSVEARGRSRSSEASTYVRQESESPRTGRGRRMRYDPDGKCNLSKEARITIEQARNRLDKHHAQSWKKRIDSAYRIQSWGMRRIRGIFWGHDDLIEDDEDERILAMPERPGLMSTLISDLHIVIDKPSFPLEEYSNFLHRVGKGMPFDMEYSLLIPLSVQIDMGEARVSLRDYPLPLLHVPAIRPGQSPRLPSWSLKTDFVIGEEYRGDVSTKQVNVEVVPPEKFSSSEHAGGFAIDVRRTVSPVKTYSDVEIAINTSAPTTITWGTSYQPAIQDMMMIIEGFTKPQVDPSDRVGFWDKIRLSAHSRVNVRWKGDGDVRLQLKGSRDPYVVTGNGAGFVMCWRNNVRWAIHQSDDPKSFMTVDSDDYVLAIPDYSHQARESYTRDAEDFSNLHQRREEFATQGKGRAKQMTTSGMRINQAQLDFISADIRAVSASIAGTTADDVKRATVEELAAYQQTAPSADISRFTIPDNDFTWIDMDDFVEIDWVLPSETNPETKILPLAFAPRFTYFRQTDHPGSSTANGDKSSPFGDEPTHFCVMSQDNDPRKVQCQLIQERLEKLEEQMEMHERTLGEQELRVVRDSNRDSSLKERYEMLNEQGDRLYAKKRFLQNMFRRLTRAIDEGRPWISATGDTAGLDMAGGTDEEDANDEAKPLESAPLAGSVSDFNNRFIIHNAQLKWNNSLRNIILRYVHQVSQRRGFIYYMSQKAVKFIDDIVKEQHKHRRRHEDRTGSETPASESSPTESKEEGDMDDSSFEDMINDLLNDEKKVVDADDPKQVPDRQMSDTGNLGQDISKDFTPQNTYHVRLIAPQIQMQSEKNPKSVLLVTAKSMQLKVVQIMDKDRIADDVSGLVQRRFSVDMDSVQFFVTSQKSLAQYLHMYSGNRYGTPKGSAWPPWVAFEVNFDFQYDPFGWSRVVQRTSASLRYDKYNTLRLKYNDEVSSGKMGQKHNPENMDNRIDHLWVDFPHIRAICDSSQYYTMYLIVLDLLLYNEPREKVRSERLEKIMLASDFSDLSGASTMVVSLQARIRQLEEIKTHFQIHSQYLDKKGWEDHLAIEHDLAACEDELFFMMKAITTSQRKNDDRVSTSQTTGLLRWYLSASEMVWHLMRDKDDPLMEIQLNKASYDRTDNSDGSNHNTMEIDRIRGLNLLPDALYPEMLGPYLESGRKFMGTQDPKMLKVNWHSLEAIAGIPVLDQFEVDLFPLKVQLEREIGQKLFEYIFPGGMDKNGDGKSPFMLKHTLPHGEEDDSDAETLPSLPDTPRHVANGSGDEHVSARQASLDMRLRATKAFPEKSGHSSPANKLKHIGPTSNGEGHHFKLFQHSNHSSRSQQNTSRPSIAQTDSVMMKTSQESLAMARRSKESSSTNLSAMNGQPEKHSRFKLNRTNSQATTIGKDKPSDDLSQMLSRASNYMTLAYVKIPSVVLCLSYKGRGERNIEDVHDFVFRMPVLEYRNKTWSNLDLALRLKKDVIRALISHTGAIIGNKLSHHRPNKQQQNRLRELAHSSILLSNSNSLEDSSETSSLQDRSAHPGDSTRGSFTSVPGSQLARTDSFASSLRQPVLNDELHEEPPSIPESEVEGEDTVGASFNSSYAVLRRKDTDGEDTDESSRKKGVQSLGKKILGSLNPQ
ncbi:hypothetical protein P7C71_g3322, partial [Lecanoromycetidae sp. Uapishka_2]